MYLKTQGERNQDEMAEQNTKKERENTNNTRDSLVVTDATTELAFCSLSMGEQRGS